MDKAEERALEVYPVKRFYYTEDHYIPTSRDDGYEYYTQEVRDENLESREKFIEGYRMAEKDLELTWEDIDRIITASNIVSDLHYSGKREMTSWKQYCEDVLKRFKETRIEVKKC